MKHIEIALSQYGTQEIPGSKHNPKILEYFAKSNNAWIVDDETAWCAAFVDYCLETALIRSTRRVNARSYLTWGKETKTPKVGDIVVFWRVKPNSAFGHVAFFIKEDTDGIWVLGGNQANMVNITKYPKSQLLAFRTI